MPRVGYPDPETFHAAYRSLAAFHDELWERTGITPARTVLGGFSMGSVMSYSLGLGAERPVPAGILAFSGFVPVVEGWEPTWPAARASPSSSRTAATTRSWTSAFARQARELLEAGGLDVSYHESDVAHQIDPAHIPAALDWLAAALA